jgi:hypothetical protein
VAGMMVALGYGGACDWMGAGISCRGRTGSGGAADCPHCSCPRPYFAYQTHTTALASPLHLQAPHPASNHPAPAPFPGKKACVIGRSNIVGMPAALLLQREDATVTIVHSRTPDGAQICSEADIVIAACGKAEMIDGSWIKPGAVVIDVGINAKDDPTAKRGYRLVGDVHFAEASKKASQITPVPGGVGPMTIAMLLSNTLEGAKRTLGVQ